MTAVKCQTHPTYQARRPPRADCERCWEKWHRKQDTPAWVYNGRLYRSYWQGSVPVTTYLVEHHGRSDEKEVLHVIGGYVAELQQRLRDHGHVF
jgi:hypothetical protein